MAKSCFKNEYFWERRHQEKDYLNFHLFLVQRYNPFPGDASAKKSSFLILLWGVLGSRTRNMAKSSFKNK